jgi:diguanylate cyclase (GGDEF)-like protein
MLTASATIGRGRDAAQIWINDPSISRTHCRIDLQNDLALVTDLGSRNYTYVNAQKIAPNHALRHGDTLKIGNVRLRYFSHESPDLLLFEKLYRMSVQDNLLGVFRKEYFLEKLNQEFQLSQAAQRSLALLFIDLDKFKAINDTYGHDAGDHVLKSVCDVIQSIVRQGDTFARYGGEEFCLILTDASPAEALRFAERMRQSVEQAEIIYGNIRIPVTISIGLASLTSSLQTPQELIKLADTMVYEAKQNGRNCVFAAPAESP